MSRQHKIYFIPKECLGLEKIFFSGKLESNLIVNHQRCRMWDSENRRGAQE